MKTRLWVIFAFVVLGVMFGIRKNIIWSASSNSNVVRSDVETWINQNFSHSEKTRALLRQAALDYQYLLTQVDHRERSIAAYQQLMRTHFCGDYILKSQSMDTFRQLLAQILNTYDLSKAWIKANKNMVAVPFNDLPASEWKSTCQFDPDQMRD